MYYNFDPCFGDNNNIKTYVRRSITFNFFVEDSNKIESINLSTSNLIINDIRDYYVKINNKYTYTRQSIMYNETVLKN